MRQRTALIVAMVLSTFVLLVAAGVIGRLAIAPATSDAGEDTPSASAAPSASEAPTEQGLTEEREAEYQQLLQTANARLEDANRQLEDAYRQLTAQPTGGDTAPVASAAASSAASPAASAAPSSAPSPAASSAPQPSAPASTAPQTPAQITADQAAAIATAYVGGGAIERVRLEEEHGQLVYEVRFTNDSRVYVDPVSGSVIYARLEGSNDD